MAAVVVIDLLEQSYDEARMLHEPLGGTQSAVLETCISLAEQTETVLFNAIASPRSYRRLAIRPHTQITLAELSAARWIVFVSWVTEKGLAQLPLRKGGPKIALWAHHDVDQRAVQFLGRPELARMFSRYLFVSRWQRDRYAERFGIARDASAIVGNPYCERALAAIGPIAKTFDRPRLIYTSTPFRGLEVLANAFPAFRQRFPDAELTVLSGMELYGSSDNAPYRSLYEQIGRTPGMRLFKPAGKLDLYRRLRDANLFAFPSTFPETFCIAALEAQVLGNPLLLTRLGALPEIFAGARFFDPPGAIAIAPERWADFMARAWSDIAAQPVRPDRVARQERSRRMHSPEAVASRLLASLTDRSPRAMPVARPTPTDEPVPMTATMPHAPDPDREFNVVRECRYGTMIFNRNDWAVGFQLEQYGEWAESEMRLLGTLIAPGNLVVDVGAHIGCHSLFFARCVGPTGQVHAFEPQRILFQTLCGNMAINSLQNVTCHPVALGAEPGTSAIQAVDYLASHNAGMARLQADPEASEPVPVRTLDSVSLPHCELIKIDVEGMERSVLEGAVETLRAFRPYIYAENNQPEKSEALLAFVRGLGYRVYRHLAPSYNPANYYGNPNCDFKGYLESNVLCVPAEAAAAFVPLPGLEALD